MRFCFHDDWSLIRFLLRVAAKCPLPSVILPFATQSSNSAALVAGSDSGITYWSTGPPVAPSSATQSSNSTALVAVSTVICGHAAAWLSCGDGHTDADIGDSQLRNHLLTFLLQSSVLVLNLHFVIICICKTVRGCTLHHCLLHYMYLYSVVISVCSTAILCYCRYIQIKTTEMVGNGCLWPQSFSVWSPTWCSYGFFLSIPQSMVTFHQN